MLILTVSTNAVHAAVLDVFDTVDVSNQTLDAGLNATFYQLFSGAKISSIPEAQSVVAALGQPENPILETTSFVAGGLMDYKNIPDGGIGFFRTDNPFPFQEHFVDIFLGLIFIDQPSDVTFLVYAVDGYQLKIAKTILVQDWITSSTSPPRVAPVQFLASGYYPIQITHFENGSNQGSGSAGLEVAWTPGLFTEVPERTGNGAAFHISDHYSLLGSDNLFHAAAIPEPSTFLLFVMGWLAITLLF